MKPAHKLDPYLEQAVAEHEALHQAVHALKTHLESTSADEVVPAAVAQAVTQLQALHDLLQKHFAQEEMGGYLEEALARAPRLAPQAQLLQRQHAEFSDVSRRMLAEVHAEPSPPLAWQRLQSDFRTFAKRLLAHEAAEDSLLQQAFNEDLGTDAQTDTR